MATRRLYLAARNTTPEGFQQAFPQLTESWTHGPWTWGCYSLWAVTPEQLDLSALRGPVLMVTTCDDVEWSLRLHDATQGSFGVVCHHCYLDPDQSLDEEEEEHESFQSWLFENCRQQPRELWPSASSWELAQQPLSEALPRFLRIQAENTADALLRFGLAGDRAALVDTFLGKGLPRDTWDRGTANLDAFLELLGLSVPEPSADEQAAKARRRRQAERAPDPMTAARAIIEATAALPRHAITDGPVEARLVLAHFLTFFLDPEADLAFEVRFPSTSTDQVEWPRKPLPPASEDSLVRLSEEITVERDGDHRFLVGLRPRPVLRIERWVRALEVAARSFPDGTEIGVHAARTMTPDAEAARHPLSFLGRLEQGQWQLTHASIELTADRLQAAFDIVRHAESKKPFEPRDETERAALLEAADSVLELGLIDKRSRLIPADRVGHVHLVGLAFRHREGEYWILQEPVFATSRDGERPSRTGRPSEPGPTDSDRVVHRGQVTIYLRPSDDQLAALEPRTESDRKREPARLDSGVTSDDARETTVVEPVETRPTTIERLAADLRALGFEPLGELTSSDRPSSVKRGWVSPEAPGVLARQSCLRTELSRVDFITCFEGKGTLLTSHDAKPGEPLRRDFRARVDLGTPAQLWEKHRDELERHAREGRVPVKVEPSLEGFARTEDELLRRLKRAPWRAWLRS
ncbi:MAG: hypothetical protein AAF533_25535 [Acidobacteriota bacterium]